MTAEVGAEMLTANALDGGTLTSPAPHDALQDHIAWLDQQYADGGSLLPVVGFPVSVA